MLPLILAACTAPGPESPVATGDTGAATPALQPPVVREVPPEDVDPAVVAHTGDHLVIAPSPSVSRDALFLFFPGTGAGPEQYRILLEHAAGLGFHAVGLSYDNRESINFQVCRGALPLERCPRDARLEVLRGEDGGWDPPVVDAANAAYPRLVGLLGWLDATWPDEGWGGFLDPASEDGVRWSAVTVAGHSQGGGHAAFTARLHRVARAVLFNATEPALWTQEPLATPTDALFGIVHTAEANADAMTRSWENLGLPGSLTSIDGRTADELAGLHRLSTSREDCRGEGNARYHNCDVADDFLPPETDAGQPFAPVWTVLLGG